MKSFTDILRKATAAISGEYFQLAIKDGNPIYRERVYCYELYHQMRCRWPDVDAEPFRLNGEVDKGGHPVFKELGIGFPVPDFLVHGLGGMDNNYAVMEVKPQIARGPGIEKDLKTLSSFLHGVGYKRAIYLLYGVAIEDKQLDFVCEIAGKFGAAAGIELWAHRGPGQLAELVKKFD